MKKEIIFGLHKQDGVFVLDAQDVFQHITEATKEERELAFYLGKWCELLNYYVFHSKELMFGDAEYARLDGWIDGYNHAKAIQIYDHDDRVEIDMKKYHIILNKP